MAECELSGSHIHIELVDGNFYSTKMVARKRENDERKWNTVQMQNSCRKKTNERERDTLHVWAITTAMTTTTTVAATRRFDYKIIILHFLLHRSHCSGQTEVIWMLFNAIESTRENGHTLHNPWFKFIISRWLMMMTVWRMI